jgi:hypothetical protein
VPSRISVATAVPTPVDRQLKPLLPQISMFSKIQNLMHTDIIKKFNLESRLSPPLDRDTQTLVFHSDVPRTSTDAKAPCLGTQGNWPAVIAA